jgi:asparagine synthase (glutamine-hydrolysing)
MCRIVGIFKYNSQHLVSSETIQKMRDSLAYGGPDDAGEYIDESCGLYLGHRRLSIIDISTAGHQPMISSKWVICYNGEVYNFKEIALELSSKGYKFNTHSDTEVIIQAFDCWGNDAVNKFRGMFAFALWNKETKKLLLCRDRVGVKPLYYYNKEGVLLFASELKALRQFPQFDATINQEAVSLYLQAGYIRSPFSIYKHAHKLEPGHFLEIDSIGSEKKWAYWNVNDIETDNAVLSNDEESIIDRVEELIAESCQLRMVADVPVGVFLSGGIDSSLVTALLQKNNIQKIKSFTIGFENAGFDESVHAKKIADYLGTDHHQHICTEADFLKVIPRLADMYDEPFGDSSAIPTHLVAAMARKQVTVSLSADGGDEVFGGYTRYQLVNKYYLLLNKIPLPFRKIVAGMLSNTPLSFWHLLLPIIGKKSMLKSLEWRLPKLTNVLSASTPMEMYEYVSVNIPNKLCSEIHSKESAAIFNSTLYFNNQGLLNNLAKTDIQTYLEGDILTKVDRATMQVALEGREPLLDHKIIEFGLSLPDEYKIRNGETKWVLKQVLNKHVPKELWDRPKWGFSIPVKYWLTDLFRDELHAMANDAIFQERFQLNGSLLNKMVLQFLDKNSLTINPHFMWSLFMLYKWHQRWD